MIKVAFYDAKPYDKPSFEKYGKLHDMQFRFLETKLNGDTAALSAGCDAVCIFVNDTANAAVIDKLYESNLDAAMKRWDDIKLRRAESKRISDELHQVLDIEGD